MNGIDAERNKIDETPEQTRLRHEARGYRRGYFTGVDLGTGEDRTVYACREHISQPHPACPVCAEVARLTHPTPASREP